MAVSNDSQWVVSGSKDRCVQFWDLRTGQAQLMLQGHKNSGMFGSSDIIGIFINLLLFIL